MNNTISLQGETIILSGELRFTNAAIILRQLSEMTFPLAIKHVSFSQATACDTTGILLMLQLRRLFGMQLLFSNIPYRLQALLDLTNLTSEFNIE